MPETFKATYGLLSEFSCSHWFTASLCPSNPFIERTLKGTIFGGGRNGMSLRIPCPLAVEPFLLGRWKLIVPLAIFGRLWWTLVGWYDMLICLLFSYWLWSPCETYFILLPSQIEISGVRCIKYQPSTILLTRHMLVAMPRQKVPSRRGIWLWILVVCMPALQEKESSSNIFKIFKQRKGTSWFVMFLLTAMEPG